MNILVIFGTRPEAIKLAPVIAELRRRPGLNVGVAVTSQHRQLLDQVLSVFQIVPDADLDIMQPRQTLAGLGSRVLVSVDALLASRGSDLVLVQGDTSSAFLAALAAFYRGVPVAHVEAGLRTESATNPFPEEMNRRLLSQVALLHFAPTERAGRALLGEGMVPERVFVTGNTVVDALQHIRSSEAYRATTPPVIVRPGERLILVTLHRRESWGVLDRICGALKTIAKRRPDVQVVMPVHPNPAVSETIRQVLGGTPRVTLLDALDYLSFLKLLEQSWMVMTDSGGVQEEAPILGRPVLVLRENTERPEAVDLGVALVVGTEPAAIIAAALTLIDDGQRYREMARPVSPFGDGRAASRIADVIMARQDAIEAYARNTGNPRAVAS